MNHYDRFLQLGLVWQAREVKTKPLSKKTHLKTFKTYFKILILSFFTMNSFYFVYSLNFIFFKFFFTIQLKAMEVFY